MNHSLSHERFFFILIFLFVWGYFQLFLVYLKKNHIEYYLDFYESLPVVLLESKSSIFREVSACPRSSKAGLFRLTKFLLEALYSEYRNVFFVQQDNFVRDNVHLQ